MYVMPLASNARITNMTMINDDMKGLGFLVFTVTVQFAFLL